MGTEGGELIGILSDEGGIGLAPVGGEDMTGGVGNTTMGVGLTMPVEFCGGEEGGRAGGGKLGSTGNLALGGGPVGGNAGSFTDGGG